MITLRLGTLLKVIAFFVLIGMIAGMAITLKTLSILRQ
jgi:MFS superfamily sulfate permease-like transporter